LDIHRPENFKYENRLSNIIEFTNKISEKYGLRVEMLGFQRTVDKIKEFNIDLGNIKIVDLYPFKKYINEVYHSKFIISDSGTAQEEPALLGTPVLVPRDFTERPESVENFCSIMIDVNNLNELIYENIDIWMTTEFEKKDISWLGEGKTSENVINILKEKL
jgi:UDP-N-acetylglucosamine 2-epimerase (non-hydrolysing)